MNNDLTIIDNNVDFSNLYKDLYLGSQNNLSFTSLRKLLNTLVLPNMLTADGDIDERKNLDYWNTSGLTLIKVYLLKTLITDDVSNLNYKCSTLLTKLNNALLYNTLAKDLYSLLDNINEKNSYKLTKLEELYKNLMEKQMHVYASTESLTNDVAHQLLDNLIPVLSD